MDYSYFLWSVGFGGEPITFRFPVDADTCIYKEPFHSYGCIYMPKILYNENYNCALVGL